ncbi:hypothetical protein ABZ468_52270 [Streptomyces sp. NPDC005708]|uniref:hypothetical protein n=1 Tax=Streptomyces sp. NPDC005708 TaxID=3154564 RepID=UPI0033C7F5BF
MSVLRDAAQEYRAAATAAGLTWPEPVAPPGAPPPPDLVYRLFDVDRVAEQVTWLHGQGWGEKRLLPNRGWLLPWPADVADVNEALTNLSLSVGVPFPWRHQLPLFHFEYLIYTFVLAGDHEGEIWRYEIAPDAWDAVRAAPSLAALFTEWAKGLAAGVVYLNDLDGFLAVGERGHGRRDVDVLLERTAILDPLAFPVSMPDQPLLRERQAACKVDMSCVGADRGFECFEALNEEIDAVRASLGV